MADQSTDGDAYGTDRSTSGADGDGRGETVDWVTVSALRVVLAVVGLVLLLYAVGRAVGVDLLATISEALGTELGRWLAVAAVALVLILLALRGFGPGAE